MKITRIKETKKKKISKKDGLLINIYYFFLLYRYLLLSILGLAILAFIILFVMDFIAPTEMKSLDKKATLGLFDQLQKAYRHQDAINLMEFKGKEFIEDTPEELDYKPKLADSYVYVGDYSKAEKMLLDSWNHAPKYLKEISDDSFPNLDVYIKYALGRTIYQFYETVGDQINQIKFYRIYRGYYDKYPRQIDSITIKIYNERTSFAKKMPKNNQEIIEYDDIIVSSFSDKAKARRRMETYINNIKDRKEYAPSYKVKCLNKLARWQLDAGLLPEAYKSIHTAIGFVKDMQFDNEYSHLGMLSDLCYEIHDIEMSKTLYKRYKRYLDNLGNTESFEYLENYARSFKYLESEGDWETLRSNLKAYSEGLKRQILINMPSMTEEQREFFAKQFDVAYDYGMHALETHPSSELANLCFDNITFKTGLLLRSNLSITNTIKNSEDENVKKMYAELEKCRLDLICQSPSNRWFSGKKSLEDKISQLEKEIALKSTDFKHKNQTPDNNYTVIQKHLEKNESVVDFVEHNGKLFALVLNPSNDVKYIPIGQISDIKDKIKLSPADLYRDIDFTQYIWKPVEKAIDGSSVIYYLPIGLFNQIAIGSMCLDKKTNTYLCEAKNFRLLSNPTDLIEDRSSSVTSNPALISLWGGIDYGEGSNILSAPKAKRTAIKRGETLSNLIYAYQEVSDIASMLNENKWKNVLFTKTEATESNFKKRAGKKDYIIHVSTHGFFNEKANLNNSMYESGLFFAGANKYWSNDTLKLELGEEDGILRAAEIATLDLTGCELVVLSACETGLGFSDTSEGVYGLQRSFKLAGAKYLLMSLWDVDDRATTLLMTEFYKNMIAGKTLEAALDESKKTVKEKYPSPEDWGAFVLLH